MGEKRLASWLRHPAPGVWKMSNRCRYGLLCRLSGVFFRAAKIGHKQISVAKSAVKESESRWSETIATPRDVQSPQIVSPQNLKRQRKRDVGAILQQSSSIYPNCIRVDEHADIDPEI